MIETFDIRRVDGTCEACNQPNIVVKYGGRYLCLRCSHTEPVTPRDATPESSVPRRDDD